MARLKTAAAEWAESNAEGVSGGTTTSTVRSGSRAWTCAAAQAISYSITPTVGVGYYFRTYFNFSVFPSVATTFFGMNGLEYRVRLNTDGTLQLRWSSTNIGSPSAAPALNTWYRAELFFKIGSGAADDSAEFRLDGVTVASETNQSRATSITTNALLAGDGDAIATGLQVFFDDLAVNDDTGGSQNSWPGDGKVVLLLPVSDNARTTGWVTGAGGTTSLFAAVANTPPVGVADTGTATSQIRNATAEASASYDANLTSYTAAGIRATDIINVVVPMVATAAPVTTSSKQGLIGMASNPAITTVALSATGTSGAFWSGNAASTYPNGWKWSLGTTTYAPSVTLASSPVARITQVTSSTRIADVCALGMYVDYTPVRPIPNVVMAPYTH